MPLLMLISMKVSRIKAATVGNKHNFYFYCTISRHLKDIILRGLSSGSKELCHSTEMGAVKVTFSPGCTV